VQTGAGSPTGICVYEGELLPRVFQNQVIHCDAGPSIVRAYPATVDGAGYKGEIVNILDGAKKNKFFRPADVCTAPDGSLFVTDWYDPGVGGHHQGEIERGRIFRVLPKGHVNYDRPKFDFSNAESCVAALKNPALSVRYLAWDALHKMGTKAEPALSTLWKSDNSRHRARALWLLGKIEGRGSYWIEQALADKDSDIRITGLRLARQLKSDVIPIIEKLVSDKVPAVRRECAIALRHHQAEKAAKLWATLAHQHDGKDRWYLEALGIGADQQWDAFLKAYLEVEPSSAGRNDVLWRSRAQTTPKHLVSIISDKQTPTEDLPRYFRAFDFQAAREVKEEALTQLFTTDHGSDQARTNLIFSEVLNRLSGVNSKDPRFSKAMSKLVEQSKGTQQYVDLVGKFSLQGEYAGLLALAQKHADNQLGANAVKTLLDKGQTNLLKEALDDKDAKVTESTLLAIATSGDARPTVLLQSVITDAKRPIDQRRLAVRALAKSKPGAHEIIKLAQTKQLAKDLEQAAGAVLTTHADAAIRVEAVKLFPVPPGKNNQPIPPIPELVKLKGDIKNGKLLFAKEGTCANCHIVNGEGKEVGPNLSEIGKKLTKEALFESILFPSAAISHNFEMYVIETKSGNLVNGVLVSQTPEEVTIKRADAILQTLKKGEVLEFQKSSISLMPADLHKNLTGQDLSDIVEYLTTLKEAAKPSK
jgi:putative heme-binding domain-containing protein